MLKKPTVLTRPTPARRDAPFLDQGRSRDGTGGVASGYVEDAVEARTPLEDFFSILLWSYRPLATTCFQKLHTYCPPEM